MIPMFKVAVSDAAYAAVKATLESGMLGEGPQVRAFAEALSELWSVDSQFVIPLNSCTSAISLALVLAGVDAGDVVISTPFTMVATNTAIKEKRGRIEWADVDPQTMCLDVPALLRRLESSRPKAIVMTLVAGIVPRQLDELHEACREKGVAFILDCAHALTSSLKGKPVAHYADYACFSFQAIKHLSSGADGGAIVVNSNTREVTAERAERLKWFGLTRIVPPGKTRLQHQMTTDLPEAGFKVHMSDFVASVGLANMSLAKSCVLASQRNAAYYIAELGSIEGITCIREPELTTASWWFYGFLAQNRDELIQHLADSGCEATPMWRRNDRYSAFPSSERETPGLDLISKSLICIPSGHWVTDDNRSSIIDHIKNFFKQRSEAKI